MRKTSIGFSTSIHVQFDKDVLKIIVETVENTFTYQTNILKILLLNFYDQTKRDPS